MNRCMQEKGSGLKSIDKIIESVKLEQMDVMMRDFWLLLLLCDKEILELMHLSKKRSGMIFSM